MCVSVGGYNVKHAIFLILCLFTGLLPASAKNIHNNEDLVSINSAVDLRQVDRSHDNADAILPAQALPLQQPALALPDAFDAAPVVLPIDIAPKPPTILGVSGSAPLPADVLSDPSIPSPFDIAGASSAADQTLGTQRKSVWDSPLAAILGLLAGILTMVGVGGRARRMSPARRVEPDARVTVYHPHAAMASSAMVHAGGDVLAASEQGGFAWAHDRQARSGSADTGQGRFGQADFRDIAYGGDSVSYGPYGNHDPVIVVYPEARGQWYQGPAETAAPAPVERTPFNIVELDYRIFTLDAGNVRSCLQFSAADDHAALALARLCEPTKAFELWRGSQLVTRQPTIQ